MRSNLALSPSAASPGAPVIVSSGLRMGRRPTSVDATMTSDTCGPKGGWMVILAIHETPSLTQERYEQVVRRLTGKTRIESPSDLPFDGLLVHAAGQGPNGFCVFDVFESEEAVERFRSAIGSIPQEVGIEEPPQFFPAHTAISTAI
jgi:hypothetical protein